MMIMMGDEERADARVEDIIAALNAEDVEALKALFSENALDQAEDFEGDAEILFDYIQGTITSSERDSCAGEIISGGGRSWMIRYGVDLKTDQGNYDIFVIDYTVDTRDPKNQGVYMLELMKPDPTRPVEGWQDRMRAGIYIH